MIYNILLLFYELRQAGIILNKVSINEDGDIAFTPDLSPEDQAIADAVIAAHDPNGLFPWEINAEDVRDRFSQSVLAGKTPLEIYQIVQTRIDSWTILAEAKEDFSEWMPLLFSVVAWLVIQQRE